MHDQNYEQVVRSMIWHENTVAHHRITWLTAVNALLVAGECTVWHKPGAEPLSYLICAVGFSVSVISFWPIRWATIATTRLRTWWLKHRPADYDGPGIIGMGPDRISPWVQLGAPWDLLPIVFAIAWIIIAFLVAG